MGMTDQDDDREFQHLLNMLAFSNVWPHTKQECLDPLPRFCNAGYRGCDACAWVYTHKHKCDPCRGEGPGYVNSFCIYIHEYSRIPG